MNVNITARHIELTPALRDYAEKRLLQVNKFTDKVTNANIVLNVEKERHIAEVTINVAKSKINAKKVAGDMYAAIDFVMDKIVKQLKKHIEKMKDHKNQSTSLVADIVWRHIEESELKIHEAVPEIEDVRELEVKKQSVLEAISKLEENDLDFWIFRNTDNHDSLNILFKKDDGTTGMLIMK
jgi:putative sigma-54 modulation protein